jgi:hypothetical protein
MQQIFMHSVESVSEITKDEGHDIYEARSYEELTHCHRPLSHRRKILGHGLALARLVFPKAPESRVASNSNL